MYDLGRNHINAHSISYESYNNKGYIREWIVMKQFPVVKTFASSAVLLAVCGGYAAPTMAEGLTLEEVVVTARKREESLQETPVSVMAFGSDALEQQDVTNLSALDIKMPNVAIGGSGGLGGSNGSFFIRGIGTTRNGVNQEAAVALYVDDTYIGRSDGALLSVMDVQQIEVSRGPQGTLFGRSATSGAIRYITKNPIDEFEGNIQATLGSESRRDLKGVVNIPISDDVAVRLAGATLNQDGHVDGVFTGEDYGDVNTDMARAKIRWTASDTVEVLATIDYTTIDNNGGASVLLGVNPNPAPFPPGPPGPGAFVSSEANIAGLDPRTLALGDLEKSYQTGRNFYESDNVGANLTVNWDISDTLSFKSSTSFRDIDVEGAYDADGSHASLFEQSFKRDIETFSQELQLSGTSFDERLNWVTGIFYYEEESTDTRLVAGSVNAAVTAGVPQLNGSNTRSVDPVETESIAIFGQGTYDLTDTWALTIGLRYTEDEKEIFANELRADGVTERVPGGVTNKEEWSAVSGRISLEWQAAEDVFLFTSFARGYRSGGFNDRIRSNLPNDNFGVTAFDEETLDMYELGLRSEFLEGRVRLNLTAFYGEYQDQQLSALIPGTTRAVFQNAGESSIQGVEGEFIIALTEILTLDGTFGLLDTEFDKLDSSVTSVTLDSEFARAPEVSYSIGLQADFDEIVARVDYGWKDDANLVEEDSANIVQEDYGLLSANITYAPADANWSISIFGNNLTDEEYLTSGLDLTGTPVGVVAGEPGRFREFGVKFNWEF